MKNIRCHHSLNFVSKCVDINRNVEKSKSIPFHPDLLVYLDLSVTVTSVDSMVTVRTLAKAEILVQI
jgi:hypothetical protein